MVRSLGQLAILGRVSLLALIVIPVVAACWPAVRAAAGAYHRGLAETHTAMTRLLGEIERAATRRESAFPADVQERIHEMLGRAGQSSDLWREQLDGIVRESPHMGRSLALTFFAAVAVTLGLLAYQVWVPDEIRKHDEDSFVDMLHQRYPEQAKDRDDGLRRAIDFLEQRAKRRADCHPNFVTHHGDTIWVPPRDRIEWFDDPPLRRYRLNRGAQQLPRRRDPQPSRVGPAWSPARSVAASSSRRGRRRNTG